MSFLNIIFCLFRINASYLFYYRVLSYMVSYLLIVLSVTQVTSTVEPPPIYSILWEWVYHRQSVTSTVEPPPIKFQFFSNLVIFIIANANGREFFLWRLYTVLEFRILLFLLFWYVSPAIQFIKRCLFLFFKWSFFLCWECWVEYNDRDQWICTLC